jgi:hypothetical protein
VIAPANQENAVLTPDDLARHYDGYVTAFRRGAMTGVERFDVWLESFWAGEAPPEPDTPPDALSILDGAGRRDRHPLVRTGLGDLWLRFGRRSRVLSHLDRCDAAGDRSPTVLRAARTGGGFGREDTTRG